MDIGDGVVLKIKRIEEIREEYIPTGELHLHGHLDPASRRMRSTLTEADPVVTNC